MRRIQTDLLHDLTERELLVVRQEVENRKKRVAPAWLLWLFLGQFGAHRLYLGQMTTGFIWLFAHIVGIPIFAIYTAQSVSTSLMSCTSQGVPPEQTAMTSILGIASFIFFWLPIVWWPIDGFFISGLLQENEKKVQEEVIQELKAMRGPMQSPYSAQMQGQPPYYQPAQGAQYANTPTQGMGAVPPQLQPCPNCGNGIFAGTNPCPYCKIMNRW